MAFVKRENGKVTGVFARRQPGVAEEALPDDDPAVLALRNPPAPTADERVDKEGDQSLRRALIRRGILSRDDIKRDL